VTVESKDSRETGYAPGRAATAALDDFKSSVKEFAQKIPSQIGRAIESIQARANAITVQVDDETQAKIDALVEAGVFKNRSDSAAYLIHEGIHARSMVFAAIEAKMAEIERLRGDMRAMIDDTPGTTPGNTSGI
jgi:Arc/MetJ-type ribon-helix-helix transcriptional regulator